MRHPIRCGSLIAVIALWQSALALGADVSKAVPEAALLQAHVSLQAAQQLTTGKTYRDLGFRSVEEAKKATLGAPFRVFLVRLDKLKEYSANNDPEALLEDTHAIRYPVYVGNEVRSGVVVREVGGKWEIDSVGRPALTRALVSASRRQGNTGASAEPGVVVSVPALGLYFVGHGDGPRLTLTSATDDARFKIEAGKTVAATEIFERLVPYARTLETGPRLAN